MCHVLADFFQNLKEKLSKIFSSEAINCIQEQQKRGLGSPQRTQRYNSKKV